MNYSVVRIRHTHAWIHVCMLHAHVQKGGTADCYKSYLSLSIYIYVYVYIYIYIYIYTPIHIYIYIYIFAARAFAFLIREMPLWSTGAL